MSHYYTDEEFKELNSFSVDKPVIHPPLSELIDERVKSMSDELKSLRGDVRYLKRILQNASAVLGAVAGQLDSGVLQDMISNVVDDLEAADDVKAAEEDDHAKHTEIF